VLSVLLDFNETRPIQTFFIFICRSIIHLRLPIFCFDSFFGGQFGLLGGC
jgi:hypothetical protein